MEELNNLVTAQHKIHRWIIGTVLSSWVLPFAQAIIQRGNFTLPFQTIFIIVNALTGTAAIIIVYFWLIRRPTDSYFDLLGFHPKISGVLAALSILVSSIFFFYYYEYASAANEICLLFSGLAFYFFFWGFTRLVATIIKYEQQKRLWNTLSDQERMKYLNWKDDVRELADELDDAVRLANKIASDAENNLKTYEREERRRRIQDFYNKLLRSTLNLREKFGLLTSYEIKARQKARETIAIKKKIFNADFNKQILNSLQKKELDSVKLSNGVIYYKIESDLIYLVIRQSLTTALAKKYLKALMPLIDEYASNGDKFIVCLIEKSNQIHEEGLKRLRTSGVYVYQFDKTTLKGKIIL